MYVVLAPVYVVFIGATCDRPSLALHAVHPLFPAFRQNSFHLNRFSTHYLDRGDQTDEKIPVWDCCRISARYSAMRRSRHHRESRCQRGKAREEPSRHCDSPKIGTKDKN